ncbi:hypothetical protein DFH09DRAFT_1273418 [Mycena vulgaris]|nr:hypothetical protein DFH09DRAFT_1273418 [Mycena vulgaris]
MSTDRDSDPIPVKSADPAATAGSIVGVIIVYHGVHERPLFRLAVYPRDDDIAPGHPIKLVRDACFVIANNKDGRLEEWHVNDSEVRSYTPVVLGLGELLGPGEYTYRVDDEPNYPICTSFRSWTPPCRLPPTHWQQVGGLKVTVTGYKASVASQNVQTQDLNCVMTGATDRLQASYLVPEGEEDWWMTHTMYRHSGSVSNASTTIASNLITLRLDLNGAGFADAHFFLYPYGGKWVSLFASGGSADLALHHNFRALRIPQRIHPMFLYARFAWNIFKLAGGDLAALGKVAACVKHEQSPLKRKGGPQSGPESPDGNGAGGSGASGSGSGGAAGSGSGGAAGGKRKKKKDDDELDHCDADPEQHQDAGGARPENCDSPPGQREAGMQEGSLQMEDTYGGGRARYWAQIDAWAEIEKEMEDNGVEVMGDIYIGLAQTWRVAEEYRQNNPAVSAVRGTEFAQIGEDDEQDLT